MTSSDLRVQAPALAAAAALTLLAACGSDVPSTSGQTSGTSTGSGSSTSTQGGCTNGVIDASAGAVTSPWVSLVLDAGQLPKVAYQDYAHLDVKLASRQASGSWSVETVDSAGNVGQDVRLALDPSGKAHLVYGDTTNADGQLKYATNASEAWVAEKLALGGSRAIAVDSAGTVRVAYIAKTASSTLTLATRSASGWATSTIDASIPADQPSLAIDAARKLHVTYIDWSGGNSNFKLKYATNASGAWVVTTVDADGNVGRQSSLRLDAAGHKHVVYWDATTSNYTLRYATDASGSWVVTKFPQTATATDPQLAVDADGKIHISYYENTQKDLRYLTNRPGTWTLLAIAQGAADLGRVSSIAVDPGAQKLWAAYSNRTTGGIEFASCQ